METEEEERRFQADLERAAALSMETLALEEFKRKQRNSVADYGLQKANSGKFTIKWLGSNGETRNTRLFFHYPCSTSSCTLPNRANC